MKFILGVAYAASGFLCVSLTQFLWNYWKARRIGLPVLITPVEPTNLLWLVSEAYIAPIFRNLLPQRLTIWVEINSRDRNYANIHKLHAQVGEAFTVVSPRRIRVVIANAKAVEQISQRRKDFTKPVELHKALDLFGSNVLTVEGAAWNRHRRITSPPFNERTSNFVWDEARRQAEEMLQGWLRLADGMNTIESDTTILALHVLTAAGLGISYPFSGGLQTPANGHSMTYRDALTMILLNLILAIIASSIRLPSWMLPPKVKAVREATDNFKQYMVEMLEKEKHAMEMGKPESSNLMSSLIRASEANRVSEKGRNALTDEEIYGNLFAHNLAGHETISNTLAFAIALLAAHPEWQEWIGEEIDAVIGSDGTQLYDYENTFPQLKRCLAVMHETLRLFGPFRAIAKSTTSHQSLVINDKPYMIPPKTLIAINTGALHTSPRYWGHDSLEWRPNRWITADKLGKEEFVEIPPGSFVPWAYGPRMCTGKKFSQVVFVSVVACLWRKHRVKPVLGDGESVDEASRRIWATLEDSMFNPTLKPKHAERIGVRWTEKQVA